MMFLLISSDNNWLWDSYFILSFPPYHIFLLDSAHTNEYTMCWVLWFFFFFSLLKVDGCGGTN